MAELAVGCSGFNYKHWRGNFYPQQLPQKKWFEFYLNVFSTVELNVTFYRLPSAETFQHWHDHTPPSFTFAIKGSRFITHIKRLTEPEEAIRRYFAAALHLKNKLKAVLWQLSPGFSVDLERFHNFLKVVSRYPVRHTFEFRHGSWMCPEVIALCHEYNVGICMADWPEFLIVPQVTADFIYIRRHGHTGSYTGCYTSEELSHDAERIRGYMNEGRDVYIYFNNDIGGHAPRNAVELMDMLK